MAGLALGGAASDKRSDGDACMADRAAFERIVAARVPALATAYGRAAGVARARAKAIPRPSSTPLSGFACRRRAGLPARKHANSGALAALLATVHKVGQGSEPAGGFCTAVQRGR